MKIFLSSLETNEKHVDLMIKNNIELKWNLMSYYYIRKNTKTAEKVKAHSELILIDSGAHTFQKGKNIDWVKYTYEYAEFIKKYDEEKVLGYFEMDVDNMIGYDKVLELRKILEQASNKIIPVWHKNRGIEEFKKMCQDYSGKIVAITGFRNEDIKDEQYPMFLKYARQNGCKVHCLGMTRKKILNKVPFDYTDSSSWKQQAIRGVVGKRKVTREFSKKSTELVMQESYKHAMEMQNYYYQKWRAYEQ